MSLARSVTAPPDTTPIRRAETNCAETFADAFAPTSTCPPPRPTNCCSQFPCGFPEPPILRRTDTSADYARDDSLARLSRLERESLRIQQELADLSYRMRASVAPLDSPVKRQIASPAPSPAPAPAQASALDMAREFGM